MIKTLLQYKKVFSRNKTKNIKQQDFKLITNL